jgi:hypothetical protein
MEASLLPEYSLCNLLKSREKKCGVKQKKLKVQNKISNTELFFYPFYYENYENKQQLAETRFCTVNKT